MYILQQLSEIFCRCWLGSFHLWCDLVLGFIDFFVWMTYVYVIVGVKVSRYHCVAVYMFLGPSEYD
jgi:hypothetical protein